MTVTAQATATMSVREALRLALREEMQRDDRVTLLGEEIGVFQGSYRVTADLLDEFGPERVRDTPISEEGFVGAAIGAAMAGGRPVAEIMTVNFILLALDQIVNNAAKVRYMFGGEAGCPLVIRTPGGGGNQLTAQHSQSFEAWFAHVPGLKVLAPASAADAKALLKAAIRDDDPVLFMESFPLYNEKGEVPDDPDAVAPIGRARVAREGSDLTIVGHSYAVVRALRVAEHLERFGRPGDVLVGADSHTTTGGALGMLSIGAGGLDVAVAMGGHPFELACPLVVEVWLEHELRRPWVQAKDVILELLRRLSVTGGKEKVFEFAGPGVATLSVPERATIANMIAELGATSALFGPDERTRDWLRRQDRDSDFRALGPDDGATYDERVEIDLDDLGPLVAKPHNPDNVVAVEELAGTDVAQVCMGSSVNSAYADLALPAAILADRGGQRVHPDVDATATPGSRQIQAAIVEAGALPPAAPRGGGGPEPGPG